MGTFFRLLFQALVLLVVALVSALTTMQIAIHGREIAVPDFTGKTAAEARKICEQDGLPVEVERQYYSASVPEGKIVSQVPDAGTRVRRGWQVRVAESLGPQRIQIPSVLGESERAAEINVRRRGLEINSVSHFGAPGIVADQVQAQSPPPNATDVAIPKINLLVSENASPQAFLMPNLVGQFLVTATLNLQDAGLRAGKVTLSPVVSGAFPTVPAPNLPAASLSNSPTSPASVVMAQDPVPGQKVEEGASVNFTVR